MASQEQAFSRVGPPPIPYFDWNNLYHRGSSLSCLIQGVYIMERERQEYRVGLNAHAYDWWERVGFTLVKPLVESDGTIYGAIFRNIYNYQNTPYSVVHPQYVIAFRGTLLTRQTLPGDVKNDIRMGFENLHRGDRFVQTMTEIQNFVITHENATVWITGHSLGAGLALLAGKTMAMYGNPLDAYIFNPPISLAPLEKLFKSNEFIKDIIRVARDIFKASIAKVLHYKVRESQQQYMNLALWTPKLYVNQSDIVCSEYIGHFKHKIQMAKVGAGKIENLASSYSIMGSLFGRESSSSYSSPQHLHFLPSAFLVVNKNVSSPGFWIDHEIQQWWNPTLQDNSDFYQFKS